MRNNISWCEPKTLEKQVQTIRQNYLDQSENNNESVVYFCKLHKDNIKLKEKHKKRITFSRLKAEKDSIA